MLLRLALIAFAYLLGSIPFSFLVVRMLKRDDIRRHGSGNVGATNVLRTAGRAAGAVALTLDLVKGWFAVALARWITSLPSWPLGDPAPDSIANLPSFWIGLAALLAVVGHMFPAWLHFRGGKGVATAAGAFLAIDPRVVLAALIVFAIAVMVSRYVSLASMLSAASIPLLLRFAVHEPFWIVIFSILISFVIIYRHRGNIFRLATGTEHRLGERKEGQ